MNKPALRQHLKEKRRALSAGRIAEKSRLIEEKLLALPIYKNAGRILFYVSQPEEVDTHSLIKTALAEGKIVFVPKVNGEHLSLCPLYDFEELEPGEFGILELGTSLETEERPDFDLIIIPGVGFDHRGHRLGHGKGHYDRLLKETRGYKVGLAFEEQVVPELPIEPHDIALDALLTDEHLFTFTS